MSEPPTDPGQPSSPFPAIRNAANATVLLKLLRSSGYSGDESLWIDVAKTRLAQLAFDGNEARLAEAMDATAAEMDPSSSFVDIVRRLLAAMPGATVPKEGSRWGKIARAGCLTTLVGYVLAFAVIIIGILAIGTPFDAGSGVVGVLLLLLFLLGILGMFVGLVGVAVTDKRHRLPAIVAFSGLVLFLLINLGFMFGNN